MGHRLYVAWGSPKDIAPRTEATSGFIELETSRSCQRDRNYAVYGNALEGLELRQVQVLIQDARSSGEAVGRRTIGRAAERVDLETG
jgi:hypothetical protein